jgi:hypothetical protein
MGTIGNILPGSHGSNQIKASKHRRRIRNCPSSSCYGNGSLHSATVHMFVHHPSGGPKHVSLSIGCPLTWVNVPASTDGPQHDSDPSSCSRSTVLDHIRSSCEPW